MGDQGLILNITEAPIPSYKGAKHFLKPEKRRGSWKLKAQKRKSQDASEGPPSKRSAPSASADIESKDTKSKLNKKLKGDSSPKKERRKKMAQREGPLSKHPPSSKTTLRFRK